MIGLEQRADEVAEAIIRSPMDGNDLDSVGEFGAHILEALEEARSAALEEAARKFNDMGRVYHQQHLRAVGRRSMDTARDRKARSETAARCCRVARGLAKAKAIRALPGAALGEKETDG